MALLETDWSGRDWFSNDYITSMPIVEKQEAGSLIARSVLALIVSTASGNSVLTPQAI